VEEGRKDGGVLEGQVSDDPCGTALQ
jgi:hypothetical protein